MPSIPDSRAYASDIDVPTLSMISPYPSVTEPTRVVVSNCVVKNKWLKRVVLSEAARLLGFAGDKDGEK